MNTTTPPPPTAQKSASKLAPMFGKLNATRRTAGLKIMVYGESGIGKTTLACRLPAPVGFIDLEESLPILAPQLEAAGIAQNLATVQANTWDELIAALESPEWDGIKTVVIDSATRAETLAVEWTLANVPLERGGRAANIEAYGYGKGYQLVWTTWQRLLAALDRHVRAGRNVCLIAHSCAANVANPAGDDWLRYEPRLQSPASGKASIRLQTREWVDILAFLAYDICVDKEKTLGAKGKATGGGTRTAYLAEQPFAMAKSRVACDDAIMVGDGAGFWTNFGLSRESV